MAKLSQPLSRQTTDIGGAATATELGGGTPASPCAALRPYQVLLASRAVAVGRWENDGAAVVTEERRGASQGRQWRRRSCCGAAAALLAAGERGGEGERRKCKWSAGVHGRALGLDVAHDSPSWPGRAAKRRRAAPRGVETLKTVGYCSTSSEPRFQPDSDTRRR